jgi:hypothetical protein
MTLFGTMKGFSETDLAVSLTVVKRSVRVTPIEGDQVASMVVSRLAWEFCRG